MLQVLRYTAFYIALFLASIKLHINNGIKKVSCHLTDTISQRDLHLTATYNVAGGNRDTICCSDRSFEEMMQFEDGRV